MSFRGIKVAFPDRLVWQSGIEFGLQAVAVLAGEGAPIEFSLIDHGTMLEAATFAVIQYQLQSKVQWVRRWPRSFAAYEVAIFPRVAPMETQTITRILKQGVLVISSDPAFTTPDEHFLSFFRRDWQALATMLRKKAVSKAVPV